MKNISPLIPLFTVLFISIVAFVYFMETFTRDKQKYCIEFINGKQRRGYCQITVGDTITYQSEKIILTEINP